MRASGEGSPTHRTNLDRALGQRDFVESRGFPMALMNRRRFTVDEYYRMGEAGILSEGDRVELIEGEIIQMPPIGPLHDSDVDRFAELFFLTYGGEANVRVQNPARLSDFTEPQPDLMLLRRRDDFYRSGHPQPEDVLLLVEIADTTLAFDRRVKLPVYARTGIREVWIVDVREKVITAYREPESDGYRVARVFRMGDEIAPEAFPTKPLRVAELLG